MSKKYIRQKAALDRRVKDFEALQKNKSEDNQHRLSVTARDIYQTAEKLGIQDEYKFYLSFFDKCDIIKRHVNPNPNDMRSLEQIDAQADIFRALMECDY